MLDRVPVTRRVKGMKRILSILCALMLFCGCGNNRDDADGDDNQSEESGKATPEQDEETAKPAQPPAETETETPAETSPQAESSPKEEAEDDETDKPLSAVLVEQGLPVLLEYAKLLREFEQGKNDSPGSLLDLAFGAANVARKLAIDVLPVEEGWQEKTGERFHKYIEEECEIIENDRRFGKLRGVLAKMEKANGLDDDFSVYLVKDKENNAFSSVGGHLYLTTGMMKFLRNDDELAWVIGHEMAHVTCGHCDRKAKTIHVAGGFGDIVETGASVGLMLTAPFGQGDEYEADSKGRQYAKEAGYDTKAGLEVLRRFKKDEGEYDDLEKMFRSHPFSEERISRLEK
jgi:beta-barrel assembly-enhancing protease